MLFSFSTQLGICLGKIRINFRLVITRVVIFQGKSRKKGVYQFFVTLTNTEMVR